jgi:hypothetical protein
MTGLEVFVLLINYQIKIHADISYKFIISKTKLITQKQKKQQQPSNTSKQRKNYTKDIYMYIYEGKESNEP